MATAGLIYNRIRLNYQCPWDLATGGVETYSNMFVLTGATALADLATAEATALDLHEPIRQLSNSGAYLLSWSYYAPNSHTATFQQSYAAGVKPCNGSAFSPTNSNQQQAEVCILCVGPTDKNSRGKQVYLRKFIHWVSASGSSNQHPSTIVGDPLTKWKTGAGPNLLVPIDPDSGTQAST